MTTECDFVVVGAGIAGASAAYFLSETGSVILLEREDAPGYHSTGRSAALFTTSYGPPAIRALAAASRPFLDTPPAGFADHPLMSPRGALTIAGPDEAEALAAALDNARSAADSARSLNADETVGMCGVLKRAGILGAVYEPDVFDLDVHTMLHGYLRGARARGCRLVTGAEVRGEERIGGQWVAETTAGRFAAPVVVNAAGAWADDLAGLAGIAKVGLVPKRRTAITFDAPDGLDCAALPLVGDVADSFYMKPEAGRILASPSDATPVDPCDVQPEDIDVAITVDRIERATILEVRRVTHKWAGLRNFVADKTMVVGMAPGADGFLWLAGQGGYGIKTSPAMGRIAAALAAGRDLPADIEAMGVTATDLSPARFRHTPNI